MIKGKHCGTCRNATWMKALFTSVTCTEYQDTVSMEARNLLRIVGCASWTPKEVDV